MNNKTIFNTFWSTNLGRIALGLSTVTILGLVWVKIPSATGKPQNEQTPSLKLQEFKRQQKCGNRCLDPWRSTPVSARGSSSKAATPINDVWLAKFPYVRGPGIQKPLWTIRQGISNTPFVFKSLAVQGNGKTVILSATNEHSKDAHYWLTQYSDTGTPLWQKELERFEGSYIYSYGPDIATDSEGNTSVLGREAIFFRGFLLAKYSPDGFLMWRELVGSPYYNMALSISTDRSGNASIGGNFLVDQRFEVPWLAKFAPDGTQQWLLKSTLNGGFTYCTVIDANGDVYAAGEEVQNDFAGPSYLWITKHRPDGTVRWNKRLGPFVNRTIPYGITTDNKGNVFITGTTADALSGSNKGGSDAWLAKFNTYGAQKWVKQLGTTADDFAYAVAVDNSDHVYITGQTYGALAGPNKGGSDAWLAKFNTAGVLQSAKQFGTKYNDAAYDAGIDSKGNVFVSGTAPRGFAQPSLKFR